MFVLAAMLLQSVVRSNTLTAVNHIRGQHHEHDGSNGGVKQRNRKDASWHQRRTRYIPPSVSGFSIKQEQEQQDQQLNEFLSCTDNIDTTSSNENTFNSTAVIVFDGNLSLITELQISLLEDAFITTYNNLTYTKLVGIEDDEQGGINDNDDDICDNPLYRKIDRVNIITNFVFSGTTADGTFIIFEPPFTIDSVRRRRRKQRLLQQQQQRQQGEEGLSASQHHISPSSKDRKSVV